MCSVHSLHSLPPRHFALAAAKGFPRETMITPCKGPHWSSPTGAQNIIDKFNFYLTSKLWSCNVIHGHTIPSALMICFLSFSKSVQALLNHFQAVNAAETWFVVCLINCTESSILFPITGTGDAGKLTKFSFCHHISCLQKMCLRNLGTQLKGNGIVVLHMFVPKFVRGAVSDAPRFGIGIASGFQHCLYCRRRSHGWNTRQRC